MIVTCAAGDGLHRIGLHRVVAVGQNEGIAATAQVI